MFWKRYRRVCGILLLVGTVIGGLLFLLFSLLVPADAGEGGLVVIVFVTVWGCLIGGGVALGSAVGFVIGLFAWVRKTERSVASIAWIGAASAAAGAALVWIGVGIAWGLSNSYLWGNFWIASILATFSAVLGAAVAVPAVVSAVRAADRNQRTRV